jgi:uncharacterized protein
MAFFVIVLIGGGIFLQSRWFSPSQTARAQTAPVSESASPANLKYRGYVNDFAGVIDPQSEQQIARLATVLDQKTRAQIAVVTVNSLGDEPIDDFANRLFQAWGVGHKDTTGATAACSRDCSLMLVLSIKDRKSRLEVGYGLEPIIPDGYSGEVLRAMRPYLRQQQYGPALYQGCAVLANRIASQAGVKLDEPGLPPPDRPRSEGAPNWVVIAIIIAVLFFGAPWWLALLGGNRWGGPRGPWGGGFGGGGFRGGGFGGGFGGYDSGGGSGGAFGGFGGFGGGASGGGGASSDW